VTYTYGRTRFERYIDDQGNVRHRSRRLPREEWAVLIRDHHPGFIDWETFEANRMRIDTNTRPKAHRAADGSTADNSPTGRAVREGAALLQGLAVCGHCGRRLRTHYRGRNASPGYAGPWVPCSVVPSARIRSAGPGTRCEATGRRVRLREQTDGAPAYF